MDNYNCMINPSSLVNTLTLRYDPSIKPNLPKKTWKDFEAINEPPNIGFIEKSICNIIDQKLKRFDGQKISIALSGGIDSTLILSLIRKINPQIDIEAVSIKFADSIDETTAASKIAEAFDTNHNILYLENYLSELPKAISMINLPFWDLHWYYVVKKSQTLSKILISGDGGDELFGGYTFRYKKFLSLIEHDSTISEKIKIYLSCHERDRVPDQEKLFTKKANFSWKSIYESLTPFFDNSLSPLEQVFLADYNGKLLYNFNPINSRIINGFDMEMLAPILNEELLSLGPHIPKHYKYDEDNNIGKLPLRTILKQSNHYSLVTKQKLGFNVDTTNLWKSYGHDLCKEFLDNSRIVQDGWLNKDWILKYIDNPELDVKYINKFLGLLALEIWFRIFITKEMSGHESL